jgi:hypothetical protein
MLALMFAIWVLGILCTKYTNTDATFLQPDLEYCNYFGLRSGSLDLVTGLWIRIRIYLSC